MQISMTQLTIVLFAAILIVIDVCFEVNFPKIERVVVAADQLSSGTPLKILHISDVHGYNQEAFILKAVQDTTPDIVVITGDMIDKNTSTFEDLYHLTDALIALNPNVFFVSGNHEQKNTKGQAFVSALMEKKVQVLNNSNGSFVKNGAVYNICGINDHYSGLDDLEMAFQGINGANYTILLSHSPTVIRRINDIRADLILCGHAHGGQVRFPFIGALIAPGEGYFPKYNKGLYYLENTVLYVDSGLGTSGLPLRFLNRSQISLIEVKPNP